MALAFVTQSRIDGSAGASSPEAVSDPENYTAGDLLVWVASHGGSNGVLGTPVGYTTPTGWTTVAVAYDSVTISSIVYFASTVIWAKIAAGSSGEVPASLSWSTGHIGRSRHYLYVYSGAPATVGQAVGVVDAYAGRPGAPTLTRSLTSVKTNSSALWAITTAASASPLNPALVVDDPAGFTGDVAPTDTTYKARISRKAPVSGTVPLPVVTNPEAVPPDRWPYAAIGVSLGGDLDPPPSTRRARRGFGLVR
jgi:hypothetical protein